MSSLPQPLKDDKLRPVLFISNWYFKNKYVRWFTTSYTFIFGASYLCLLLHCVIRRSHEVQGFEVLTGALSLTGIVIVIALYDEKSKLEELQTLQERIFWSDDFFTEREKFVKRWGVYISIFGHWLVWYSIVVAEIVAVFLMPLPKIIYNINWPTFSTIILKVLFHMYSISGFFLANVHVCYYGYVILHGYFQMQILINYLRHEIRKHQQMTTLERINGRKYQKRFKELFVRCVKQHRNLTDYGTKISIIYGRWMVWLTIFSTSVFSANIYWTFTEPSFQTILLYIFSAPYHGLICLLYMTIAQYFTDGYEDFHSELMNVQWYALNSENKKLYYMLLIFTQKEVVIQLLPSVVLSRSLFANFWNTVYSGITLMQSMQH